MTPASVKRRNSRNASQPKKRAAAMHWRRKNAKAIEAYNRRIERYGVFSDGLRRF
ncbi:MAG: type II toxin-antitoxin system CcdA family antitoxin [Betaproteobacteria bacterium]|nr:type II toxin-antitoxin system CcdA family antitoxin [Betaproteobacteria bacterium]